MHALMVAVSGVLVLVVRAMFGRLLSPEAMEAEARAPRRGSRPRPRADAARVCASRARRGRVACRPVAIANVPEEARHAHACRAPCTPC